MSERNGDMRICRETRGSALRHTAPYGRGRSDQSAQRAFPFA